MASPPGFRAVGAVTLQVGGVSVRAGFRCDAPAGFARGAVESFLVQIYRCCSCLFTCGEEGHMNAHLSTHLSTVANQSHNPALSADQSHSPGHMMSPQEFSHSGDKEEDEDLFLYDMFDISAQGEELQVGHTCQVSSLFEEHCSLFKEDTDQSAHLRTLGLCRITVPRSPTRSPTHRSPPRSPTHRSPAHRSPTHRSSAHRSPTRSPVHRNPTHRSHPSTACRPKVHTKLSTGSGRRSRPDRDQKVRPPATKVRTDRPRARTKPETKVPRPAPSPHRPAPKPGVSDGTKKIWRKAQERNTQKQKDFLCSVCHRSFSSALTLRRHAGVHSDLRPFCCSLCPYSSRLKASLLQHQRTHTGERPFRCPVCPYASIDRSSLLRHQRMHNDERPHHCTHCSYTSIQKKSLDLHLQRHHREIPPSRPGDLP